MSNVRDSVRHAVSDVVRGAGGYFVWDAARVPVWAAVEYYVRDAVGKAVGHAIENVVWVAVADIMKDLTR